MDIKVIDTFTSLEMSFNVAGTIPIVSLISGALRVIAGKIQALAGGIIALVGLIGYAVTHDCKWKELVRDGHEFAIHGALNALRGFGEALLCATTVLGNVFLLIPNLIKEDNFTPYFAYGSFGNEIQAFEFA